MPARTRKMSLIFSLSASKRCHKPHAGSCCPMRHLVKAGFAKDVTEPRARDGHSTLAVSQKMSRPLAIPGGLAFRILLSVWLKMSRASILQTAFLNKALFDRRDVRLGIAKRVRRRVDRVVAEDEIVLVRSGRAENELAIGRRFEFDRFARWLESREVPVPQFVRNRHDARCDGGPEDGVARRRLVTPALAGLQADREIIDRRRGLDGARCGPVAAEEDASRTVLLHVLRTLVDADGWAQFELRRQGDPELDAARPACLVEAAPVPHPASGLHPFDAAGRQCALDVVRVDIADRAFHDVAQSGDPRVGMQAPVEGRPFVVDQVEKHEWLEDLAEIRWAHQTCGVGLGATTGTLGDRSRQARRRFGWVKDGHWVPPRGLTLCSCAATSSGEGTA